ncbi:MAG: CoA pyrophosphatase [Chloroflexi bacterium]|nr:CoA pyrophosphatase [Chloroflexota bacterium]
MNEDDIRRRLRPAAPTPAAAPRLSPPPRIAAVLVPLYRNAGEWHMLFTERSEEVADHKGQVSFPGGQSHPQDADLATTALRETHEEIGLDPREVRVLGLLQPMLTVTNFWVTPVVGAFAWPQTFHLAPVEVREVFGAPLRWLADATHLEWLEREHPLTGEHVITAIYAPYEGHTIWGATARIALQVLEALIQGAR